jgi:hypothetical protein
MTSPAFPARIAPRPRTARSARTSRPRLATGVRALGAAALAAEGAVHLQQFLQIVFAVPLIGPLFVLNAVGCAGAAGGLLFRRTVRVGALAGIAISLAALAGLAKSYAGGFLGWTEAALRPPVEIAIASEAVAIVVLAVLLVLSSRPRRVHARRRRGR